MGYSKAQKTKTHERIVKLASKRFREVGLARIGIAELMKEAGRSFMRTADCPPVIFRSPRSHLTFHDRHYWRKRQK
jgi:hypothetical protein